MIDNVFEGKKVTIMRLNTNLGIKKLDFAKRGVMSVYLTDGRVVMVSVSAFPDIKSLSRKKREDYMIMDEQYFSFEAMSRIYSIKDVLNNKPLK